jgi:hypothetical protein
MWDYPVESSVQPLARTMDVEFTNRPASAFTVSGYVVNNADGTVLSTYYLLPIDQLNLKYSLTDCT